MLVAIDAGHGNYTQGKRCLKTLDPNETREHILNGRVADYLQTKLDQIGVPWIRTDDPTGRVDISLSERANHANAAKADLFLSIHHNAGGNGLTAGAYSGVEVYYYSTNKNRKNQALQLYQFIVNANGNRGNRANHAIYKNFAVLRKTKMPAFLIENGFMDSAVDTPKILTAEYAEKTANGICAFIVDYFDIQNTAPKFHVVQPGDTLWAIAAKYYGDGNKWELIQQYNSLPDNTIYVGQKITIP